VKVLGVDPGVHGALVVLDTDTDTLAAVEDMPIVSVKRTSARGQSNLISESHLAGLVSVLSPDVAWIERVHAMPKQGVTSSFNFGLGFGLVLGVLAASKVPFFLVSPTEWKREFRLGPDKQQARILASRRFPHSAMAFARVRDDGRAEAALLAVFGAKYPL
jgi:Holliday junction resolvasome RuvABC endonuclease subunit